LTTPGMRLCLKRATSIFRFQAFKTEHKHRTWRLQHCQWAVQGIAHAGLEGEEPESRIRSDLVRHIMLYMTAFIELKQAQV